MNVPGDVVGLLHRAFDRMQARMERLADPYTSGVVPPLNEPVSQQVHSLLGVSSPCNLCGSFSEVWSGIEARLPFATPNDGSPDLAETIWIVARHLRPTYVVETGVAQGISTAVCLSALEANGNGGRLWSIDLPPLRRKWHGTVAGAVPEELRMRWTYMRGSSRRLLPALTATLPSIDLFVHDGMHTYNNMMREFRNAWPAVARGGGCVVADDVYGNPAFLEFAASTTDHWRVISGVGVAMTSSLLGRLSEV